MDYIALSTLIGVTLLWVVVTYDIGCQWSKKFRSRMEDFPEHMRISDDIEVGVAIPGWHINGHGKACQDNFNLGYMKGAGRTCGDEIEGSWSHTNPLAVSVREVAPAARHETLNDHWNGWNYRKVVGLSTLLLFFIVSLLINLSGGSLLKKFKQATVMKAKHEAAYQQLTSTFSSDLIKRWEGRVEKWENDRKGPNPYCEPSIGDELSVI